MSDINISLFAGDKKRLLTGGKYCPDDIVVEAVGGASAAVEESDVNFYDYDGTLLYAYTLADVQAMDELPPLPAHDGLICQGWNWSLEGIKTMGRSVDVGAVYITDDGKTRIYITLCDGRTSPMLGCCPSGTVTVDWGDGTEPDVLTGNSVAQVKWTPTHEYAAPGDYIISLTVEGTMRFYGNQESHQYSGILRYTSGADVRNYVYRNAVRKVEIGEGIVHIANSSFHYCQNLESITIPDSVTTLGIYVFSRCYSLKSVTIPRGVKKINSYVFEYCRGLLSITIPDSVTSIATNAFASCEALGSITVPDSVTSIGGNAFISCMSLLNITIPRGVTSIANNMFGYCHSLSGVVFPDGVTSIAGGAFEYCYGVAYYDFTALTAVPELSATSVFTSIAADCEIRVPAALADEWKTATNWATYANRIVGV